VLRKARRWGPPLLLITPSLILIAVFVYGLIAVNAWTSATDMHTAAQSTGVTPTRFVWFENYAQLLGSDSFQHSLKNLLLYTVVFLAGAMFFGFLWAWLLDRKVRFEGLFRSVYLFPMAVSFVASGVVWRWLLVVPAVALESFFALGCALIFARVGARIPDTSQILPFILRTWLYISGIFYSITIFSEHIHSELVRRLLEINPGAVYVELVRDALLKHRDTFRVQWQLGVVWAVVMFIVGFIFFWRAEEEYGRG